MTISIRVKDEETVAERLRRIALARNQTQGEVLVAALDALEQGDLLSELGGAMVKKFSKEEKVRQSLAASDLTAQGVGREDIEYGQHTELPRGEHVARMKAPTKIIQPASTSNWRAGRKPLMKPKDQK